MNKNPYTITFNDRPDLREYMNFLMNEKHVAVASVIKDYLAELMKADKEYRKYVNNDGLILHLLKQYKVGDITEEEFIRIINEA